MITNVGKYDGLVRLVIGLAIIAAGVHFRSLWGLIGLVPLFTAVTGWCPVYHLFGISSRCSQGVFCKFGK